MKLLLSIIVLGSVSCADTTHLVRAEMNRRARSDKAYRLDFSHLPDGGCFSENFPGHGGRLGVANIDSPPLSNAKTN